MKKIIHNLRQQPEEIRRHILHVIIFIFAVLLFIIWVYTLGASFSDKETQAKVKDDLRPFSTLKDNFINGYNAIRNSSLDIFE